MSPISADVFIPPAPYRGLEPYRFCDETIFFERDTEAERLFRLVTMYRGTLLYGESGAGKSSLINAGFVPKALSAGMNVERLRVQPRRGAEFVVERIPRSDKPLDYLTSVLAGPSTGRTTLSPLQLLAATSESALSTDLLLIFDQFEELLTLASEEGADTATFDRQDEILATIVSLLQARSNVRLRLMFVFREDYLAKFDRLFYFCPELVDRFMRLTPPPASSLRKLLRGPFESTRILRERGPVKYLNQ